MKLMVSHDVAGKLVAIVACRPQVPTARVTTHIGHLVTEIDAPEIKADANDSEIYRQMSGLTQQYHIDNGALTKDA
jgi:hypothetical protein